MLWLVLQTTRTGKPSFPSLKITEHKLTLLQLLHRPGSPFPLVRQGNAREGQIGRRRHQDGLKYCLGIMHGALRAASIIPL